MSPAKHGQGEGSLVRFRDRPGAYLPDAHRRSLARGVLRAPSGPENAEIMVTIG